MTTRYTQLAILVSLLCGPVELLADGNGSSLGIALRSGRPRYLLARPADRETPAKSLEKSPSKSPTAAPAPTDDLQFDIPQTPRTMNGSEVGTGVESERGMRPLRDHRLEHSQPSPGSAEEPEFSERLRERLGRLESHGRDKLQSADQDEEKKQPKPRGWLPFAFRRS